MLNRDDLIKDRTSPATQYSASWWEFLAISASGALLVGAGLTGLGAKALNSAIDPQRSEAIAKSIIDYRIPGGSKGAFGAKIGGIKVALITNTTTPPDTELFVAQIPEDEEIDKHQLPETFGDTSPDRPKEQFTAIATRIENKSFCGVSVPVTVQEGELSWQGAPSTMPAVRYSASTLFKNGERLVQLTTSGDLAHQRAVTIFDSLRCQ
jgi:hypothetical protein